MNTPSIVKFAALLLLALIAALVVGWIVWVPSPTEPGYQFIAMWGSKGTAPGQFRDPTGIVVTESEVFVSDSRNGRIQVFDLDGGFKREFQGSESDGGMLGRPMNLAISDDELFVADYWNDRVHVFDFQGNPQRVIGRSGDGPGEFNAPGGVDIAPSGDLYVADFYNQRVQRLSRQGEFIEQWGSTGKVGIFSGQMNYPTDVALGADGTLFVADGYNDRVQVFAPGGAFVRKWGGPLALNVRGPFNGWFHTVSSIAVGPQGAIYTADFYNHRIQKFSVDGALLAVIGAHGSAPGQLERPLGTAIARDGTLYITDFGNNRVQKWRPLR